MEDNIENKNKNLKKLKAIDYNLKNDVIAIMANQNINDLFEKIVKACFLNMLSTGTNTNIINKLIAKSNKNNNKELTDFII